MQSTIRILAYILLLVFAYRNRYKLLNFLLQSALIRNFVVSWTMRIPMVRNMFSSQFLHQ